MAEKIALILGITLVLFSALTGVFMLDDYPNILHNQAVLWQELSIANSVESVIYAASGILNRPISVLSFGLNYWVSGADAFSFKTVNLIIHLANALLVFSLISRIKSIVVADDRYKFLPLVIAFVWAIHPLQISSTFYVVQRMTLLSSFFMLIAFNLYLQFLINAPASRMQAIKSLAAVVTAITLGLFCKENAVLAFPVLWLVDYFHRQSDALQHSEQLRKWFFVAFLWLPALLVIGYSVWTPGWILDDYALRDFNLLERLLSQTVIVAQYLLLIVWPNIDQMGLFHDDFVIIRGFNLIFAFALTLHVLLIIAAVFLRKKALWVSLAIGFYYANHLLESTLLPLELVFEHRNYLALLGPVAIMCSAMWILVEDKLQPRAQWLIVALFIGYFAIPGYIRAHQWGDSNLWTQMEVDNHPESVRARHAYLANITQKVVAGSAFTTEVDELFEKHLSAVLELDKEHLASLIMAVQLRSAIRVEQKPQHWEKIYYRVEHSKVDLRLFPSFFKGMMECTRSQICQFSYEHLNGYFEAAQRNSYLNNDQQAEIHALWALHEVYLGKDHQQAWQKLDKAKQLSSDLIVYESIAAYFMYTKDSVALMELLKEWPAGKDAELVREKVESWLEANSA